MAGFGWRDNSTGREIRSPWPIPGDTAQSFAPMVKETPLGKAAIFADTFEDASVIVAMMHPGGARFMRISPETDWALEERKEGETPPEIAADLDYAWSSTIQQFAERNRELRAERAGETS